MQITSSIQNTFLNGAAKNTAEQEKVRPGQSNVKPTDSKIEATDIAERELDGAAETKTKSAEAESTKVTLGETTSESVKEQQLLDQQIGNLAKRDREVKNHERTHAAIAGAHGGSPQYQYTRGPDGVLYAISGQVQIDASPVAGNPEATIRKAQTIQRAALAPSDPSGTDRAVAAKAGALEAKAVAELAEKNAELLKAGFGTGREKGALISIKA